MGMGFDMDVSYDSDDEYEKFVQRMNPPRVVIDNESCADATIVRVDSANKSGMLLEVVQVLIDLNLVITKAYVTSDAGWFMDVFNVTDREGNKLRDQAAIDEIEDYICKSLGADSSYIPSKRRSVDVATSTDCTIIELTGNDRPGLLSEVSAVLAEQSCNLVNVEIWSHNTRAAAVIHVTDISSGLPITEPQRLSQIKERLSSVLKGTNFSRGAKTVLAAAGATHRERRIHQLMFDDHNYEMDDADDLLIARGRPNVTVRNWNDKDYSVVTIRCKDRPKLLFDTVCALTDMRYVVFHANVDAQSPEAYQEFYIRNMHGSLVGSDSERELLIHCLEAAIQRRDSEGLKLELCTGDKVGLLSKVTRIFREHGLALARARVSTRGGNAIISLYVAENPGSRIDARILDNIRKELGQSVIQVKPQTQWELAAKSPKRSSPVRFLFGGLFRAISFLV